MRVEVNGTALWFDVDGPSLVPGGRQMRERPTVVLLHGGPGTYDHSYLKPHFSQLATVAQIIYLDLRGHGRSARGEPSEWTFETWADDVRVFCDVLGLEAPVVFGHSMGGFVAMLYGARHPGHAGALVLQSTTARFDVPRLVAEVRRLGGDEVGDLAASSYSGQEVTAEEWARVFAVFGPTVPDPDAMARRTQNLDLAQHVGDLVRTFDVLRQLDRVASPTLVAVGDRDPITPVAAAREIVDALPRGIGRLEVLQGAGHFPWLDTPDQYWPLIHAFVATQA